MPLRAAPPPAPVIVTGTPRPHVSWIDPDGNIWDLSDLAMGQGLIATSLSRAGGPPVAFTTLPLPSGNAIPQTMLPQPQNLTLGLYAEGSDVSAFHTLRSTITRAFWTVRAGKPAAGTLRVSQPDGSSRQMACYCTSGLDQGSNDYTSLQDTWSLTLFGQPYWSDSSPQPTVTFFLAATNAGIPPLPPVLLGASSALGSATVVNDGDADAYPVWIITGPGQPTIVNNTTGRSWGLSTSVPGGDVWTVVTAPDGQSSVTDQNGNSHWAALTAGIPRDLWPLVTGTNDLSISLAGATSASSVAMYYTRQWLRA